MTSDTSTARCPGCAASVLPGFAPAGAPVVGPDGQFRTTAPKPAADLFSESRWRAGSVTFGPVGRMVFTFCIFLPYPLFLINLPFGLVGVILWTALVPRALRDIWRPDRRHHLPPPD